MRNWSLKLTLVLVMMLTLVGAATAGNEALNVTAEDGILVFESDDSAFKWWVDARVYLDVATYFDDGGLYNPDEDLVGDGGDYEDFYTKNDALSGGFILRRARLALKSQLWQDWYGEIDLDFAEEATAVKDAYISYRGFLGGNGRIRVGNFRQPQGLEEVTTSRNLMFMERSQGTEPFVVGRRMGLEVTGWQQNFRWSAAMFGADVEDFVKEANEQINFAARLNWTPIQDEDSVLLLGASGALRKPTFVGEADEDGERSVSKVKFNTRPETNVSDTKFVYAGLKDVKSFSTFGGEVAYKNKRFLVQGEYMGAAVSRYEDKKDISYGGGYGFVSLFLTDDTHGYDYKDAEFARVVPTSKSGAWEVAARYSFVDMNDETAEEQHGKSTSITLGVNYYPNPNVKLMLNYGIVDNDEYAVGKDEQYNGDYDFSYLQMRFQTAF